ncbi:MAG: hypothetical protein HWE26_22565 [Alteromonadaceae bacterium]|nr:hypothetical protein [Alteromonadaceae bacterium]
MRFLLITATLFPIISFACSTSNEKGFEPYAIKNGETSYRVFFPVSDKASQPMFIDGITLVVEEVVGTDLVMSIDNQFASAQFELQPNAVNSTTIIGSYNFGDKEGTILAFCANWKAFKLKDLLESGENV